MNSLLTSNQVRDAPIKDVDYILAPMQFRTTPMEHQARCLLWAAERKRLAYWLDVGTGKTLLALYTLRLWGVRRALVVCPNPVVQTWADEIDKHLRWDYAILKGTAADRKRILSEDHNLYIINYEGLRVLWGRKMGKRFHLDLSKMNNLPFDALIADEIHRAKNPKSLTVKILRELSRRVRRCIVMTGTPLTNDHKDLWAEMSVMDLGKALGTNYWRFVHQYFRPAGFDWKLKSGSLEKILWQLQPHTIRFERDECFELPDRTYQRRNVLMTLEQLDLTDKIISNALEEDWNRTALLNVGNKLAQVAGGFLLTDNGTERLKRNPKIDELRRVVEEIEGKFIVYHHYIEEGRMVEELFAKMGLSYRAVRGEIKDQERQLREFKSDESVRALVAHPACGGEGINLFEAATIIFISNSYNFVHRKQAEGRIYRLGQQQKCLYIDIVAVEDEDNDGIDSRILSALGRKADAADEVLDYIQGKRQAILQ